VELIAGFLLGIATAGVAALINHFLAKNRARAERREVSDVELLDRCAEVFNARVKYVIAYNTKAPDYLRLRGEYHDIKRRYRWADPEVILLGTEEWADWMTAERDARQRTDLPLRDRIKAVEQASYPVLDALAARRSRVRDQ